MSSRRGRACAVVRWVVFAMRQLLLQVSVLLIAQDFAWPSSLAHVQLVQETLQ
jgi:hypothetical protein